MGDSRLRGPCHHSRTDTRSGYRRSATSSRSRLASVRHLLRVFFFFQAEDGIRDLTVTGVQTCALPIYGFDARLGELELGLVQRAGEAFVLAGEPLGLDEEAEALVEGEGGHVGLVLLLRPRRRHGIELERVEFLERGRREHRRSFTGSSPAHGDVRTE